MTELGLQLSAANFHFSVRLFDMLELTTSCEVRNATTVGLQQLFYFINTANVTSTDLSWPRGFIGLGVLWHSGNTFIREVGYWWAPLEVSLTEAI